MKVKFVRWLGAFRSNGFSLSESAQWELSQLDRQVASEPLVRGKSRIKHALIGLVVDHDASHFVCGWESDAWTSEADGLVMTTKRRSVAGKKYRCQNRFLAAMAKNGESSHGEAVFDYPKYSAVAVKKSAPERVKKMAADLSMELGLPVKEIDK